MRILSTRARDISHDRFTGRVAATVILRLDRDGAEEEVHIRTSAPVHAPGGATLKERLFASAKLRLALSHPAFAASEAEAARPAA
jgi:hypothetical protein